MPADVGLIRAKLARLKPEERIRLGLGDQVDSIRVGLLPRAAQPTSADRVRMGQGDRLDSLSVGLIPRAAVPSEKAQATGRLVEAGSITPAKRDSLLAGVAPKEPRERFSMAPWYLSPENRNTPEGQAALKKATEGKQPERRSLVQAGAGFAKTISDVRRLMEGKVSPADSTAPDTTMAYIIKKPPEERTVEEQRKFNEELTKRMLLLFGNDPNAKPVFEKGSPARQNLQKKLGAYGDSSAIVSRALEEGFAPDNDFDELIGMFPVARQALAEYDRIQIEGGRTDEAARKAAAAIKAKYGYTPEMLRKVNRVETGE